MKVRGMNIADHGYHDFYWHPHPTIASYSRHNVLHQSNCVLEGNRPQTWKELARQKMSWKAKAALLMARKPKHQVSPRSTEMPTAFWRRLEICCERDASTTFRRLRMTRTKVTRLWSRIRPMGRRRKMNSARPGSRKQLV